jgi:hypothetical protein
VGVNFGANVLKLVRVDRWQVLHGLMLPWIVAILEFISEMLAARVKYLEIWLQQWYYW